MLPIIDRDPSDDLSTKTISPDAGEYPVKAVILT
tara:strand:+ start:592 stop:693 length:102 start_codon:yes stop_codon:yes gene_type:complete